ncbi:15035_t:CDS:2 [Entrophospora sp. SA101]|nr:15035_t:CDS:2 [Entrophospora sp. SA101]CAJ0840297.1 5132_t:CDS:2 [Entrophospora sp. SA101]CAJ0899029.1 14801_t:CDS:2 [Entrophospora sp. SA101]
MATFIRKFRYQTVLSSLLQQNRLPATIVTYRFSSSSIIKYKSYATEVGRSDSEDIHPRFSDTADNNNKTSMNTNNADGTSFPSLPEFSSDNNKNARSKSEELTIKDLSNDITDGGQD